MMQISQKTRENRKAFRTSRFADLTRSAGNVPTKRGGLINGFVRRKRRFLTEISCLLVHAQRLVFRFETDTVSVYRGALAVTAYGSRAVTPPDAWYSRKCMANRERPPVTRFVHRGRPAR